MSEIRVSTIERGDTTPSSRAGGLALWTSRVAPLHLGFLQTRPRLGPGTIRRAKQLTCGSIEILTALFVEYKFQRRRRLTSPRRQSESALFELFADPVRQGPIYPERLRHERENLTASLLSDGHADGHADGHGSERRTRQGRPCTRWRSTLQSRPIADRLADRLADCLAVGSLRLFQRREFLHGERRQRPAPGIRGWHRRHGRCRKRRRNRGQHDLGVGRYRRRFGGKRDDRERW
jgi:hypothetical protein